MTYIFPVGSPVTKQKFMDDIVAFWRQFRWSIFLNPEKWIQNDKFVGILKMDFGATIFSQMIWGPVELRIISTQLQELEWVWSQRQ